MAHYRGHRPQSCLVQTLPARRGSGDYGLQVVPQVGSEGPHRGNPVRGPQSGVDGYRREAGPAPPNDGRHIPTKVNKRRDGGVEAVFDMLGALVADAKIEVEFDGTAAVKEPEIKLEFEMYHRNHPNPPREWLRRGLVMPECAAEDGGVEL